MTRDYNIHIHVVFAKPLVIKVQLESDAAEIQRQTARLDQAGNELRDATLSATPPEQKPNTK